jgi:hypothetical protein
VLMPCRKPVPRPKPCSPLVLAQMLSPYVDRSSPEGSAILLGLGAVLKMPHASGARREAPPGSSNAALPDAVCQPGSKEWGPESMAAVCPALIGR